MTRSGDRHLTLVFLGRMPREHVLRFWESLPPLTLPDHGRPVRWELMGRRALALTLADDDGHLGVAADACFEAAAEQRIELRRPDRFRPHVTLARVPKRRKPPTPQVLRDWPVPPGPVCVGPPTLFRSREDTTGDRYEIVEQQD